jgi:hypothetical protein
MVVDQLAIYSALERKKLCAKAVATPEFPELNEVLAQSTAASASTQKDCERWLRIIASAQNTDPQPTKV